MRDDSELLRDMQTVPPGPGQLVVGLVNNMSDGAMKATVDQFSRLLQAACPGFEVSLELFSCRTGSRRKDGAYAPLQTHRDVAELFNTHLDAVIVTGMEPQATDLQDEPAWIWLTKIADWAQLNGVPVIWSCLAAHVVVFYLDGVQRSRLPGKLSGVFKCAPASCNHPLTADLPRYWSTPHSRHNGLCESALTSAGYQILSRSEEAGVDSFFKPARSPHLFFQGHLEYDFHTLLSEYVRDVRRYLAGAQDDYPATPRNYFDAALENALNDYRGYILGGNRHITELTELLRLTASVATTSRWCDPAARLYANWITHCVLDAPHRHVPSFASGFNVARQAGPVIGASAE